MPYRILKRSGFFAPVFIYCIRWAHSSVVERCPDKTEVHGSIPCAPTGIEREEGRRNGSFFVEESCCPPKANPPSEEKPRGFQRAECEFDSEASMCAHPVKSKKTTSRSSFLITRHARDKI